MNAKELRSQSKSDLEASLTGLRREQFKLRLAVSGGEFTQTHRIRSVRRAIARIQTLQSEARNSE